MENILLAEWTLMIQQQDSTAAHNANIVTERMNNNFQNRSIDACFLDSLPATLTVDDYFFWGPIKELVHNSIGIILDYLKNQLRVGTNAMQQFRFPLTYKWVLPPN